MARTEFCRNCSELGASSSRESPQGLECAEAITEPHQEYRGEVLNNEPLQLCAQHFPHHLAQEIAAHFHSQAVLRGCHHGRSSVLRASQPSEIVLAEAAKQLAGFGIEERHFRVVRTSSTVVALHPCRSMRSLPGQCPRTTVKRSWTTSPQAEVGLGCSSKFTASVGWPASRRRKRGSSSRCGSETWMRWTQPVHRRQGVNGGDGESSR